MSQRTRTLYEEAECHDADFTEARLRGDTRALPHAMDALDAEKKAQKLERIEHPEFQRLEMIHDKLVVQVLIAPYIAILLVGILFCVGIIAYKLG